MDDMTTIKFGSLFLAGIGFLIFLLGLIAYILY